MRLHFRATESVRAVFVALGAAGVALVSAGLAAGCGKTTGGTAVPASQTALSATTSARLSDPAEPVPGVEVTLPEHIPPNGIVCMPPPPASGSMAMASVPDPLAPVIVLPLPDGWSSARGTGDVALISTGSRGMSVKVTISPTDLDAGGAFLRYTADLRTAKPGTAVTDAPAQFCGYSSQLLSGTVAGSGAVDFAERITHIWTNTKA